MAEPLLARVAAITREAAALALARFRGGARHWEKAPGNPVSEADLEIDALLRARLGALLPEAGWLSEETADDPARLAKARLWVVDPIDGTRDFVRGRGGWAVSVALVEQGQPVLAVLDAPVTGTIWTAEAGRGAACDGVAIACSGRNIFAGARVPAHDLPREDRDLVAVAQPNSIALRLAMVADGRADLVATLRWGHEWDIAAASLIAREAGARVTDAFGAPLAFNTARAQAFGVIASAPAIHAAAVARLESRARALVG